MDDWRERNRPFFAERAREQRLEYALIGVGFLVLIAIAGGSLLLWV